MYVILHVVLCSRRLGSLRQRSQVRGSAKSLRSRRQIRLRFMVTARSGRRAPPCSASVRRAAGHPLRNAHAPNMLGFQASPRLQFEVHLPTLQGGKPGRDTGGDAHPVGVAPPTKRGRLARAQGRGGAPSGQREHAAAGASQLPHRCPCRRAPYCATSIFSVLGGTDGLVSWSFPSRARLDGLRRKRDPRRSHLVRRRLGAVLHAGGHSRSVVGLMMAPG